MVRDEQDVRALAEEIAALTRRQQRGEGDEDGMNDWFEWNGRRCTEYGIHVLEQPPLTLPAERVTFTDVPGRSGSLTTTEGEYVYEDMVLTAQCFIESGARVPEIAAWLREAAPSSLPTGRRDITRRASSTRFPLRRSSAAIRIWPLRSTSDASPSGT